MILDESVIDKLNICSYTVAERLISRRNDVLKISAVTPCGKIDFVRKRYLCGDARKEYSMLKALEAYRVPKVLYNSDNELCAEYISGKTLLEVLESSERAEKPFTDQTRLLVEFLEGFYKRLPGMRYGDVNLRNFILSHGLLYGVDLEEVTEGEAKTDIGRAAAFIISYQPSFTQYKFRTMCFLITYAAARLKIQPYDIVDEMLAELSEMEKRRGRRVLRQGEDFVERFYEQAEF